VLIRFACVALPRSRGIRGGIRGVRGFRGPEFGSLAANSRRILVCLFFLAVAGRELPFWVWGSRVSQILGLLRRRAIHLGLVL